MKSLSFLLVDDKPLALKELTDMLKYLGFKDIQKCGSASRAWTKLSQQPCDCIISTWDMPEMSGIAFLKLIRNDERFLNLPFFIIDPAFTKIKVVQAGKAGVTGLIVEPFPVQTLKTKIERIEAILAALEFPEVEKNLQDGLDLLAQGEYDQALETFEAVVEKGESAEVYYNIGYVKTVQEKYEEAIPAFQKAVKLDGLFAKAYEAMGKAYKALGKMEEAEKSLHQAAEIYMNKENDQEAEDVLNEIKGINPDTVNVYNSLGVLYRRRGDFKTALKHYQKALKVHPEEPFILYNIGRLHIDLKDVGQAKSSFAKALSIKPDFKEAKDVLTALELGGV